MSKHGVTRQARPRVKKLSASESMIQRSVLDWLKAKGIFAVRLNNAPVPTRTGGFRPVAMKGMPDCHVDYPVEDIPVSVWVEFKTERGKLTEHKIAVREAIASHGGFYFVIQSIDAMQGALEVVEQAVKSRIKIRRQNG